MRISERRRLREIENGLCDEDPALARLFDEWGVPESSGQRRFRIQFAAGTSAVLAVCAGLCFTAGLLLGGLALACLAVLVPLLTVVNQEAG